MSTFERLDLLLFLRLFRLNAKGSIAQEESLPHVIVVRSHLHTTVVVSTGNSSSLSLLVGFSIQDEVMCVTRFDPQLTLFTCCHDWELRREHGVYSTPC